MANSEMDYIHGYMADQTYDPTSMNAQSGIAVAQAISESLENVNITFNPAYNVTNLGLIAKKFGNIIFLAGRIELGTAYSGGQSPIAYLPKPATNYATAIASSGSETFIINDQGYLCSNTAIGTGGHNIMGFYFCEM